MNKLLSGVIFLTLGITASISTIAIAENIISLPPIAFSAPPSMIVIPGTYTYADPDISDELYFWDGSWWRLWQGNWYRSSNYDQGWEYYDGVPDFYNNMDPNWRNYYNSNNWQGQQWNYIWIPNQQLQQNWSNWKKNDYWRKHGTWGVRNFQPQTQQQVQQMQPQEQKTQQTKQPQAQKPKQQQFQQGFEAPSKQQVQQQPQEQKSQQTKQSQTQEPKQQQYQQEFKSPSKQQVQQQPKEQKQPPQAQENTKGKSGKDEHN